ncbi:tetratricopeptide repeat protein [Candidatus Nitrosopelagicus sp.]|nr:tetratricopeptide repeat protein [Candidatus Nitrosopelagicus sp.]|tara:strand:- start:168 stop:395 length:228 start_codon:yes stop_codon:yes gene_type:complete
MRSINELVKSGKKYLVEGKFTDALGCFEQSLLLDPKNPNLLNLKGAALRSLGRYDEALDCYNKSLELDPRDKASS